MEPRRQARFDILFSVDIDFCPQQSYSFLNMSVRVVARIRPLLKQELDKDTIVTAEAPEGEHDANPTVVRIPNPKNDAESFSFQFNAVYEQDATQQQIFDSEGVCSALVLLEMTTDKRESISNSETSLQRRGRLSICLWRDWNRQDSYHARRQIVGGSRRHTSFVKQHISSMSKDREGFCRGDSGRSVNELL